MGDRGGPRISDSCSRWDPTFVRRISEFGEGTEYFGGLQGDSLRSKRAQLLEALKGDRTLAELSARYKVQPNLITIWKRQAGEGLVGIW
jgi:hypothetical protein